MATEEQTQAVRTALTAQLGADFTESVWEGVAVDRFVDEAGQVDGDRVTSFARATGAARTTPRNFGAGRRQPVHGGAGVGGAAEAERRFGPPVERKREGKQEPRRPNSAGLAEAQRRFSGQRR